MNGTPVLFVPMDAFIEGHGWRVSIVYGDEQGHFPTGNWPYDGSPGKKCPWFVPGPSLKEAEEQIAEMNEARGISKEQAFLTVTRSMSRSRRRNAR